MRTYVVIFPATRRLKHFPRSTKTLLDYPSNSSLNLSHRSADFGKCSFSSDIALSMAETGKPLTEVLILARSLACYRASLMTWSQHAAFSSPIITPSWHPPNSLIPFLQVREDSSPFKPPSFTMVMCDELMRSRIGSSRRNSRNSRDVGQAQRISRAGR